MLLLNDILFFPTRGLSWIFREICNAALEETANEAETITVNLSELYMMLETRKITEAEFDIQESLLLDRLAEVQERGTFIE